MKLFGLDLTGTVAGRLAVAFCVFFFCEWISMGVRFEWAALAGGQQVDVLRHHHVSIHA